MAMNLVKLPTGNPNLLLRVSKGHYATSHSHINYYIDVTLSKFRLSEARAVAAELVSEYKSTTIIDTILCLDGTEVIGACMASELTKDGFTNMNRPTCPITNLPFRPSKSFNGSVTEQSGLNLSKSIAFFTTITLLAS